MAIAYVDSSSNTTSGTTHASTALSGAVTVGNLLIASLVFRAASAPAAFSWPGSWASVASVGVLNNQRVEIGYLIAASATDDEVTITSTETDTGIVYMSEYSGMAASPLDIHAAATASGGGDDITVTQGGAINEDDELLWAVCGIYGDHSADTYAASDSFTVRQGFQGTAFRACSGGFADRIVSSKDTYATTQSGWVDTFQTRVGVMATFKMASGTSVPVIMSGFRHRWG